jgi:hypothetical protein
VASATGRAIGESGPEFEGGVQERREQRLRELEQRCENLEKIVAHREDRIEKLSQHADNLEELRAQHEIRIRELSAHAGNLEREWTRSRERAQELAAHASNLEREVAQRDRRIEELSAHASNLEQVSRDGHDPMFPGFRSRFGGLWVDRVDAAERLGARRAAGEIDAADAEWIEGWRRDGIALIPGAVDRADVIALRDALARAFRNGRPRLFVEDFEQDLKRVRPMRPEDEERDLKVLDAHALVPEAQPIVFAEPILRRLRLLFERPPLAFQSLFFRYGTEQAIHQDTAYVALRSPLEFVGCWVALEDVRPGTGELEYYVGSHALPDYVWDGRYKAMPPNHPDHGAYLEWLHSESRARGLERRSFLPKLGDALIWSADLAHGGSRRRDRDSTRLSLVTHYCPADVEPVYLRAMTRHSGCVPVGSAGFVSHPYREHPAPISSGLAAARQWLARWSEN